jgi:hypothetical protein
MYFLKENKNYFSLFYLTFFDQPAPNYDSDCIVRFVCLVGSSEDELWLRLWLSSVPGHARPSSGGAFALRLVVIGQDFGLGWGARHHRP